MRLDYLLPPVIVAVVSTILLGVVLWQRRPTPTHRTFRLILLCTGAWGALIFLVRSSPDAQTALFWDRPTTVVIFANFVLCYQFSLQMRRIRERTLLLAACYAGLGLVALLSPTDLIIRGMEVEYYGYTPVLGVISYLLFPLGFSMFGAAIYNLVLARRAATGAEERNRLLYLIVAMTLPFVGAVLDLSPVVYPLAMLGAMAFCVITTVAMLKYHLLDIRIVLRKGLTYALCMGLAMGAYALLLLLVYFFLTHDWEAPLWLNGAFIVGFSLGFQPLLRWTQTRVDRLFYRERYDYLRALERVGEETRLSLDWVSITSSFLDTVTAAMRCEKAALLLADLSGKYHTLAASRGFESLQPIRLQNDSVLIRWLATRDALLERINLDVRPEFQSLTARELQMLDEIEAQVLLPLKSRDGLRGVLILGPKLSEEAYSLEEASVLRVVARQMATALDNARLYVSDKLTGLYNRAFLEEEMRRLDVERQLPFSVIMGDLNGLKLVNDALGHQEGDRLLVDAAQVLRQCCRKEDIIARWGGDEFVILLPQTSHQDAMAISARIRRACEEAHSGHIQWSMALGAATKEEKTQDMRDVVREAEERMYRNKLMERNSSRSAILSSLEQSLRETSHETEQHAERMQYLALRMGKSLGLSDSQLDELALLAALHDIGKIAIPKSTLDKPGRLTAAEWEIVKKHPEIGYRIAMSCSYLAPIAEGILAHHERWDGTGYPQGLRGEAIPLSARIIAIIDAYDVMTTGRAYQPAMSHQSALAEISRCARAQFDPTLAEVFVAMVKEIIPQLAVAEASPPGLARAVDSPESPYLPSGGRLAEAPARLP